MKHLPFFYHLRGSNHCERRLTRCPKGTRIYFVPGDKVTLWAVRINYRNPSWAYVSRYLFPRIYIRIFAIYIFTGPRLPKRKMLS